MPPKRAIQVRFLSAGPKNCYLYILDDIDTLKNIISTLCLYILSMYYLQVAY